MDNNMLRNYAVSELADIWECSLPIAKKHALSNHKGTTSKVLNGKTVDSYFLSEKQIDELNTTIKNNQRKYGKQKEEIVSTYEAYTNHEENVYNPEPVRIGEQFMDYLREKDENLTNIYKEHTKQLEQYSSQIKLLTVSEELKKQEAVQLQTHTKELQIKTKRLKMTLLTVSICLIIITITALTVMVSKMIENAVLKENLNLSEAKIETLSKQIKTNQSVTVPQNKKVKR